MRWRAWTRGGSAISGARTVGAGARYRVCGRCAVEGVDKGRECDIGCADGARWRGGDKGRERDIGCADGARWRAWTRSGGGGGDKGRERDIRCAVQGGDKRDIGCADGARWRAGTRDGRVRGGGRGQGAGARYPVRGGGRGQGAGARYRVRGRCAVKGGDKGRERENDKGRERDIRCADGARWRAVRAGTRGGSADGALEGGDKGRERDIGCADGARWRAWESCGLPFCQYSLCLGFRVPGLTLFPPHLFGGAQATRRQAAAVGGRLRGARASSRRELKEGSSGGSLGSNRQLGRTGSHQQPEEGGGFLTPAASSRDAEDDEAAVACTEQLGVSLPAFALRCSGQSNPRLCIGFRMQQAFMQKQGDKSSIYGGRPLHTTLIRFFFFFRLASLTGTSMFMSATRTLRATRPPALRQTHARACSNGKRSSRRGNRTRKCELATVTSSEVGRGFQHAARPGKAAGHETLAKGEQSASRACAHHRTVAASLEGSQQHAPASGSTAGRRGRRSKPGHGSLG